MNVALLEKKMSELKLKPVDVASKTGVNLNSVLRILDGRTKKPQPLTIRALAALIHVSEEQLFTSPPRKRPG